MRISTLPVMWILYTGILFSCTTANTSLFDKLNIPVKHYENTHYGVTLDYPEEWYFKEQDGLLFSSVSSFDIAIDGGAGIAILMFSEEDVQKEFKNMTLDMVIESFMTELNAEFPEITDNMIGGIESRQVEFTVLQEQNVSGELNILIYNQNVYIFMIVANPPDLIVKHKQLFMAIYESIEFIEEEEQS